jgi:hypothetical protein
VAQENGVAGVFLLSLVLLIKWSLLASKALLCFKKPLACTLLNLITITFTIAEIGYHSTGIETSYNKPPPGANMLEMKHPI